MSRELVNAICEKLPGAEVSDPWGGDHDAWKVGGYQALPLPNLAFEPGRTVDFQFTPIEPPGDDAPEDAWTKPFTITGDPLPAAD